jgi:hypothetical protein
LKTSYKLNRALAVIAVFSMLIVSQLGGRSVLADSTDGRINNQVWSANGVTIAVYCLDKNNNVATNFDGGIKILNQNVTEILRVNRQQINFGQASLTPKLSWVLIGITSDQVFSLYMLYAQNGDGTVAQYHFQINNGATRIGYWTGCQPTGDPVPTTTPCISVDVADFVGVSPCCPTLGSYNVPSESLGQFVGLALPEPGANSFVVVCCGTTKYTVPDSSVQFAKFAPKESTAYIGRDVEAPIYAKPCP